MAGIIVSINISQEKGTRKKPVKQAVLVRDHGILNDAHAGQGLRQVSLLAEESVEKMRAASFQISPGDFAENFTTQGLDLLALPIDTILKIGEAELKITRIGKECHAACEIRELVGDCVMPREGVFAQVIKGGQVKVEDTIEVMTPESGKRKAAVLTVSDSCFNGSRIDESGPLIERALEGGGWEIKEKKILPDELDVIVRQLKAWSDELKLNLVITTGGTGLSPRDQTPEATISVVERRAPGISELLRLKGLKQTPVSCLSRGEAGVRGKTLIVNLPGSPRAVREGMKILLSVLNHALEMIEGKGHTS